MSRFPMKKNTRFYPERWLGLGLAFIGVFLLGFLWPKAEPLKLEQSIESATSQPGPNAGSQVRRQNGPPPDSVSGSNANDSVRLPASLSKQRVHCRVLQVFDGDTLACDVNGDGRLQKPQEEVRLLGIDSPEMHYSRKNPSFGSTHPQDEPFAREASQWLARQARIGKTLYLESDARPYDRYGRRLSYVFATPDATVSLNEQALASGYCQTLFLGKNRRYQSRFESVERQAQQQKRGMWGGAF
jgi:micrococcal nuclease